MEYVVYQRGLFQQKTERSKEEVDKLFSIIENMAKNILTDAVRKI